MIFKNTSKHNLTVSAVTSHALFQEFMKGQPVWERFPRIAKVCKSCYLDKWEGRRRIFPRKCTRYLPSYNELSQHGRFKAFIISQFLYGSRTQACLSWVLLGLSSGCSHLKHLLEENPLSSSSRGCWQNLSPRVDFSTGSIIVWYLLPYNKGERASKMEGTVFWKQS